ncbi:MAG: DUF4268 domain-containing protein [Bacteroidetes bacterium]|nr:DUF4268 domain-containing protein [Bacteroidota bacterium]
MKKNLSRLVKTDLRKVWNHEAQDFTTWLAQDINLELLSEEIGIDIKLIQTEAGVGKFNVDILAEEETTGRKIIIENQLEITDHNHLGKVVTYASGYDANIIIWIVKDVREEHKRAVEWLNEHTDEDVNFFLIKIEVWQIGNSFPAPKFNIISRPNEWAKVIKNISSSSISDTKLQQQQFWSSFSEFVKTKNSKLRLRTPKPQHWYNFSIGSSHAHIGLTINTRDNFLGCEIYIPRNKELFNHLKKHKKEIEKKLGQKLEWKDANIASRILLKKQVRSVFDNASYEDYFQWFYDKTIIYTNLFGKLIKSF